MRAPKITGKLKLRLKPSVKNTIEKGGSIFSKKVPFYKFVAASFLINIIIIAGIVIFKNGLPPEVPLYYGLPAGSSQLAPRNNLIFPPLIAILFITTNVIMTIFINQEFLKKVLIFGSILLAVLMAITSLKIFFLVGAI